MAQVVLVTGSNSGFGRRIVHTLAKNGHTVFASMRNTRGKNADAVRELDLWAQQENMNIRVLELDVTELVAPGAYEPTASDNYGGGIQVE